MSTGTVTGTACKGQGKLGLSLRLCAGGSIGEVPSTTKVQVGNINHSIQLFAKDSTLRGMLAQPATRGKDKDKGPRKTLCT